MLRKTNNLIFILTLMCLTSCSKAQDKKHVFLSTLDNQLINYSRTGDNGLFIRTRLEISNTDDCIISSKIESFKLIDDILYVKQNIQQQEIWYPYLLLNSGKCIAYSEVLPFATFLVTNCLLEISEESYTIHHVIQTANGDVERESLITLNKNWIPVKEKQLRVPFGEDLREYNEVEYSNGKIPKKRCN
jgi:hypothetical protein